MGLVASQSRLCMLVIEKDFKEADMQRICQTKMDMLEQSDRIGDEMAQLSSKSADLSAVFMDASNMPDKTDEEKKAKEDANKKAKALQGQYDAQKAIYQSKLDGVNNIEKKLDVREQQDETQYKSITTEIDSVTKIIDKNVQSTFKYVS